MPVTLPDTMRAAQWTTTSGGIDKNLRLNPAAALPRNAHSLPKHSTLVKVAYATPNPVDYKLAETLPFIFSKPAIPCLDYSGVVVDSTLPHLKTGELVFGKTEPPAFGALAEYLVVDKEGCVPLPDDVSLKDAACVGVVGLTAYQCLAPYVKEGGKVFINGGSGGTGTFGIQIAKALGCQVTTTCSGPNVELCKSLGADAVIDYRSEDPVAALKRAGKQYDLVVGALEHDHVPLRRPNTDRPRQRLQHPLPLLEQPPLPQAQRPLHHHRRHTQSRLPLRFHESHAVAQHAGGRAEEIRVRQFGGQGGGV